MDVCRVIGTVSKKWSLIAAFNSLYAIARSSADQDTKKDGEDLALRTRIFKNRQREASAELKMKAHLEQ